MPRRRSQENKESSAGARASSGGLKGAWMKIPDVATAAIIGSVVALLVSPISLSLTYYLSRLLSQPILSIEYVEAVSGDPTVTFNTALVSRFLQSPGYMSYIAREPNEHAPLAIMGEAVAVD